MHHSLIHAVNRRHPSASAVIRLASRWIASHMLSDVIPHGAVELMVAKIYTDSSDSTTSKIRSVDAPPSTLMAGFLKFLQLLFSHDWEREPLIVDPQNHISQQDQALIFSHFDVIRGYDCNKGPAMWIISPADYDGVEEMTGAKVGQTEDTPQSLEEKAETRIWSPNVTATHPERVVLSRASALAKCSHDHLIACMRRSDYSSSKWIAAFQESSSSLASYSVLLRVDTSFVTDSGCCSIEADCAMVSTVKKSSQPFHFQSTFERSIHKRVDGPKKLRQKHYKNVVLGRNTLVSIEHLFDSLHLVTFNIQANMM